MLPFRLLVIVLWGGSLVPRRWISSSSQGAQFVPQFQNSARYSLPSIFGSFSLCNHFYYLFWL